MSTRHERERLKAAALAAQTSVCAVCGKAVAGEPYSVQRMMMSAGWGSSMPVADDAPDITETLATCSLKCAVFLSVQIHMSFVDAWDLDEHIMGELPGATHEMILSVLLELTRREKAAQWKGPGPAPFVSDSVLMAEGVELWERSQRDGKS